MLKLNSELRAQAREALRGKWPMAAVAALIYSVIAGGLSAIPVIGGLCSLFVGLPVAYGFTIVMLGVCSRPLECAFTPNNQHINI